MSVTVFHADHTTGEIKTVEVDRVTDKAVYVAVEFNGDTREVRIPRFSVKESYHEDQEAAEGYIEEEKRERLVKKIEAMKKKVAELEAELDAL